jgi:hypothetical protein
MKIEGLREADFRSETAAFAECARNPPDFSVTNHHSGHTREEALRIPGRADGARCAS